MAYWRLYYHLVWATQDRQPLITLEIERMLYRHLGARASQENCHVFAINGMADHVHMILAIPPAKSVSMIMQRVKGASSHLIHTVHNNPLVWQEGYGAFSISPRKVSAAIQYIIRQKEHHQNNTFVPKYEMTSHHNDGPTRQPILFE
jgi:putative transposase